MTSFFTKLRTGPVAHVDFIILLPIKTHLHRTRQDFVDFLDGVLRNQFPASSLDNFPIQEHSQSVAFTERDLVLMNLLPKISVFNLCNDSCALLQKSPRAAFHKGQL